MESRNATFLETPPYSMTPVGINENYGDDVFDLASFLDFSILNLPDLRAKMRGMLQDNVTTFLLGTSFLPEEPRSSPQEE